jgi:GT2 family glycosyltransferase
VRTTFEPRTGLALARNKGWRIAKANIIAFTDDDCCYVPETYVDSIVQVFHDNAEAGFLGGRILLFDPRDYNITTLEPE